MYQAIEKTWTKRTALSGPGVQEKYWEVSNEQGLYANITESTVEEEDFTAEEFATVLVYALNNGLPTSLNGGITPEQYAEYAAMMRK